MKKGSSQKHKRNARANCGEMIYTEEKEVNSKHVQNCRADSDLLKLNRKSWT